METDSINLEWNAARAERAAAWPRSPSGGPETLGPGAELREAERIMLKASATVAKRRRDRMRLEVALLVVASAAVYITSYCTGWFEFITRWFVARRYENADEMIVTALFVAAGLALFSYRRLRETQEEMSTNQQVQAALMLMHDELDRLVRQRTGELDNANDALRGEIEARERTAQALGESDAQFRQVVENIHEVFWIVDPVKGKVLYVSPTYEKIWCRSCLSACNEVHFGLDSIHQDDLPRVMKARKEHEADGTYDEEFRIVRPDGATRWIHDRASPVRDRDGVVYRIVGVAEDVTDRKQLEEQFHQAQKMEAVGTLAGGIAHDFNNILTAIIGYTELADMTVEGSPRVHAYLGSVLQAAARATGLVRQILTFSRRQKQERLPMNLRPVVEETVKLLRATLPTTIEFQVNLAEDTPTVLADSNQIHQVLMNLGTNAWYAMRSRTGRLTVSLERWAVDDAQAAAQPRLRRGTYARICVRDTGCGMDGATLKRVFEPFFTTKPPGQGTGLGLAVVHGIMDTHEGAVTVASRPGEGTTFAVYFPENAATFVPPVAVEGPIPRGHGERILVIDDEEVLAVLVQKTLTELGYDAVFTTLPEAALELVLADPRRFALVLTDQTMPAMTGLILASRLREIRPDLPVIVMTGYTAPLLYERVEAAGVRELMLKPVTVRSLAISVNAALTDAPKAQGGTGAFF